MHEEQVYKQCKIKDKYTSPGIYLTLDVIIVVINCY